MVKKVTLSIPIKAWVTALLIILFFCASCETETKNIYVDHVSGEVIIQRGETLNALSINTIISKGEPFDKIDFKSGFAIFRVDSTKLILPKQGKNR